MSSILRSLFSTVRYRFSQFPDLDAYIKNRTRLANYNLEGLTIKLANMEDFQRLAKAVDKFQDFSRINERVNRRDVCAVAYKNGVLAHARWAALIPLPYRGHYTLQLDPDEAYLYDSYTVPRFRRQGIGSEARVFLMDYLQHQGIRCTYTDSRMDNINTHQSMEKRVREGRQRVLGVIIVTTCFGMPRYTFTAESEDTRLLMSRLFRVPLPDIRIHSILS